MVINDLVFTDEANEFVTASSDGTARLHKFDVENKTIEHKRAFTYTDFDTNSYTENFAKQTLGVVYVPDDKEIITCNLSNDLNVYSLASESDKPAYTIRGHTNVIRAITIFDGKTPITGCNDGRILSWDMETGQANRPLSLFKFNTQITSLASNSKYVYASSGDQSLMIYGMKEEAELQKGLSLYPLIDEFVKRESSAQKLIATETVLYIFGLDKTIQAVKADNITEVIGQTEKLEEMGEKKGAA